MDDILFSIVIPVYNVEKYIGKCINHILMQQESIKKKIEIILVDDGSSDNSGKICDKYKEEYPDIIKVIHKKNQGLLMARRTGYEHASGEYIINCDSDDFIADNMLIELQRVIEKTNADVVLFNMSIYKGEENVESMFENIFSKEIETCVEKKDIWDDYLQSYHIVSMCCKAYKRNCVDMEKDYTSFGKLGMGEDALQSLEIYERAKDYVYLNMPLYFYRQGTGMTGSFREDYYYQFKQVFREIEKKVYSIAEIENKNEKLAKKYWGIVGRAITQCRNSNVRYSEHKKYLEKLYSDEYIRKYLDMYKFASGSIQKSHKIMCDLFLKRHFGVIFVMFKIKNIVG